MKEETTVVLHPSAFLFHLLWDNFTVLLKNLNLCRWQYNSSSIRLTRLEGKKILPELPDCIPVIQHVRRAKDQHEDEQKQK